MHVKYVTMAFVSLDSVSKPKQTSETMCKCDIYFLTCKDFECKFQTLCGMTFRHETKF